MVDFLGENEVPFDIVDDGTKGKPFADLYIDDKAWRFKDDWDRIGAMFIIGKLPRFQRRAA